MLLDQIAEPGGDDCLQSFAQGAEQWDRPPWLGICIVALAMYLEGDRD